MSKTIITSADLQAKYEKLYAFLMEYLWEFKTVQALANLELAIFKRFPDKEEMQKCFRALKLEIFHTYKELSEDDQKDFEKAVDDLEQSIEDYEDAGCELYGVEVYVDTPEEEVAASEDIGSPEEKRKFEIGDIKKTTAEEKALQEEAAETLSNPFEEVEE